MEPNDLVAQSASPGDRVDGTKVLVAAGRGPLGRPCIRGELVWVPPLCGDPGCCCADSFGGASSHGLTDRAIVTMLTGVDRRSVRTTLEGAICRHCEPDAFARRVAADTLLDTAARFPVGTVLIREHGVAKAKGASR